jgi:hypothetical protein
MDLIPLIRFWNKVITGKEEPKPKSLPDSPEPIKDFLYERTLTVMPEVAVATGFENVNLKQDKQSILRDVFKASSNLPDEDWSFFPQRILKTKKATCAGNTLLVNYLLKKAKIDFEYGRPEGHSMNFVHLNSETWWLDGANATLDKVDFTDNIVNGVKVRTINSNNPKIPYKLVRVLEPRDIIINFFGNMTALKGSAKSGNKYAIEVMNENEEEIDKIDFEKWLFYLYPDYMRYTTQNEEFLEEIERIKNWQES